MDIKEVSKEKLFELLTTKDYLDKGVFGILIIQGDSLYKIHYKTLIETYLSEDINKLDEEIELFIVCRSTLNDPKLLRPKFERLERTSSDGVIRSVLSYKDVVVGVEITYLKDYISLSDAKNLLTQEQLSKALATIWDKVNELLDNDVVFLDIKEDNIMINMNTLDIKLIDLDGAEYGYEGYVKKYPYKSEMVAKRFAQMCERLNLNSV